MNQQRRHDDPDDTLPPIPSRGSNGMWRFKREVSSGDLILAISLAGGMFMWGKGIEQRVAIIEDKQVLMATVQAQTDSRQDQATRDGLREIKGDLAEIRRLLLERTK